MRAYVVFRVARWTAQEFYWTGQLLASGAPQVSSDTALALGFTSARKAYEAVENVGSGRARRRLLWWHVGLRRIRRQHEA